MTSVSGATHPTGPMMRRTSARDCMNLTPVGGGV